MSVTDVRPYANSQGGVDAEGNRTYTNLYDVYTDDKDDGSITARFATGIPAHGDRWEWYNDFDDYALCVTRNAELSDIEATRKKWRVTCTFTTALQKRNPAAEQQEPTAEPWKISGSYAVGTRVVNRNKDGEVNCNSVQEPVFDEIPSGNDTLILEGNTATIDLAARKAALLHTNKNPLWGLGEREWLLMQWSYDIGYRGPTPYVHNRLEFHAAKDDGTNSKWNHVYVDHGTRIIVDFFESDPNLRYKPATARDVQLLGGVYLDGNGSPIDLTANPNGYEWTDENIPEFDFATLGFLPDPLPGPFV